MINSWLLDLPTNKKISRSTANKMLAILRIMLDEAVKQNLISSNPATLVKPLIEKANARDAFTKDEAAKLLGDPEHWGNELSYTASLLCACTGLRAGEIRALRVMDIHSDHISVQHSWDEKFGLKSTKSGKARIVPITDKLHKMLMDLAPDRLDGFVFSLNNGESPMSGRVFANSLYRKMREIGITEKERQERGLSFHSWRHFFNTQLVANGISGEITRAVVGHESEDMTNHYLHLKSDDMERVKTIQRGLMM
jgi:integrase